ncbi:MAG: hypothetical protein QN163_09120 [Armatimonadota bacterium]|nr:hypothetical protein [Armatimonadota bacterium]MDR5697627.1 hypothetical protein [Armatimonadota bacterium]
MRPPARGSATRAATAIVALALVACQVQFSRVPKPEPVASLEVVRVGRITDRMAISNASWSPEGDQIAFGTQTGVFALTLATGQERRIVALQPVTGLDWSPSALWLAAIAGGRLFVVDAARGTATPLPTEGVVRGFRWGPGGERGVAIVERDGYHAWLLSRDGGVRRPLLSSPSGTWMGDLGWYPDGVYAFVRIEDASGATRAQWRVRVAGGDRAAVPPPVGVVVRSVLSADGRWIAYVLGREGSMSLWVGRSDGSSVRRIAHAVRITDAAWSPQSDKVAYAEVAGDEQATIWIADADGRSRLHVTDYRPELADHGFEVALAWSPTGRALAFGTNTAHSAGPVWIAHLARR